MAELNRRDFTILMVICVIVMSQASQARVLHGFLQKDVLAMGPKVEVPSGFKSPDVNFPGKLEEPTKNSPIPEKVIYNYRPLLLNLLPKGPVPPSGPSKRTNDVVG
ncbi:hypothetical protein Pint_35033 [Pistacia integerrima]|uniref:Uncharacterized protein n=1 Tax=Pistacia integerrima TaxID=434235 RepID=A0ACC0Y4B9_9ROSI|nr:hypothetical protein Pint_35033 [Pistacia integerrima]